VKTGFYPLLNTLVSNIAIIFCFAPFLMVLWKKLRYERTYTLIGLYWLTTGLLNQYNWLGNAQNNHFQAQLMFVRNLIGTHFVLVIFLVRAQGAQKKTIFYTLLAFILFELVMMIWNGLENDSNIIIIGLGALLVLMFSIAGLVDYLREMEHSSFQNTMAFIYAAFLFAYGGTTMIYILNYLNVANTNDPDEFFLYYVGLLLSSLLTCFGLWQYAEKPSFYKSKK
jgi:hypothetical protein